MTTDPARPAPARLVGASSRTLFVALTANVGVAVAKIIAAIVTGSTAMLAEAAHAIADVGNQLLLAVAQRRSRLPADDRRPFGYGREAYFWRSWPRAIRGRTPFHRRTFAITGRT